MLFWHYNQHVSFLSRTKAQAPVLHMQLEYAKVCVIVCVYMCCGIR